MTTPTLYLWLKPALLTLLLFLLSACGGGSTTASGTITAGNAAPVVANVSGTVDEDTAKSVTLPGTDADGNALTYSVVTPPAHGGVTVSGGTATYTPAQDYNGSDSFTYKANDGTTDSAPATVSIAVTPVNDTPRANAGGNQTVNEGASVTLTVTGTDVDGDPLTYNWLQADGSGISVTLSGNQTPTVSFTAPVVTADTTLIFAVRVWDDKGGYTDQSVNVLVRDATVQPSPTGVLNDTGITRCGDYAFDASRNLIAGHTHSSSEDCTLLSDVEGDPIPPTLRITGTGQDGHVGRDVTHNDDSDGHAGFSFTKLDVNGVALADQTVDYATTPWSCVKDNVTGLIWEVKTDDSGLHDKDDRYTRYSTETATNGGAVGTENIITGCFGYTAGNPATYCNTEAYVNRVNAAGWCGANSGWRMPTVGELLSIADLSRTDLTIDTEYFPHVYPNAYWSGTPQNVGGAWVVSFYNGDSAQGNSRHGNRVWLVRSGQ